MLVMLLLNAQKRPRDDSDPWSVAWPSDTHRRLEVLGDNKVVINWMNGAWEVKGEEHAIPVRGVVDQFVRWFLGGTFRPRTDENDWCRNVFRESNKAADTHANWLMDNGDSGPGAQWTASDLHDKIQKSRHIVLSFDGARRGSGLGAAAWILWLRNEYGIFEKVSYGGCVLKNASAMIAEREAQRKGIEHLTVLFPTVVSSFDFQVENSGRTVQYKLNAQSLRLFGLHSDVNDAHRAGANKQTHSPREKMPPPAPHRKRASDRTSHNVGTAPSTSRAKPPTSGRANDRAAVQVNMQLHLKSHATFKEGSSSFLSLRGGQCDQEVTRLFGPAATNFCDEHHQCGPASLTLELWESALLALPCRSKRHPVGPVSSASGCAVSPGQRPCVNRQLCTSVEGQTIGTNFESSAIQGSCRQKIHVPHHDIGGDPRAHPPRGKPWQRHSPTGDTFVQEALPQHMRTGGGHKDRAERERAGGQTV